MSEAPAVVVLAGGQARRMGGGDKSLCLLDGRPMLAHVLERVGGGAVALSANGDPARFAAFGLPVLADEAGAGPLAGVLAGMIWAASHGHASVLSVPSDCPFLPLDLAQRLQAAAAAIACAESLGRVHHATALWAVELRDSLAASLRRGVTRVQEFVDGRAAVVHFDAAAIDPFFNVNTPRELEKARGFAPRPHHGPAGPWTPSLK